MGVQSNAVTVVMIYITDVDMITTLSPYICVSSNAPRTYIGGLDVKSEVARAQGVGELGEIGPLCLVVEGH